MNKVDTHLPQAYAARAKINLFLHVLGRRADGYHLLQTAFRLLDYSDTLYFTPRQDSRLTRSNIILDLPEEKDLCIRAARLLQREANCNQGMDIRLEKRLPMGGGLGGGSSDAASTLLALNDLWGLHWSLARLQALGLQLGADVPFFIFGQNAFAEGIGEKLTPLVLPPAWYLVLVPPVTVSTAEIFCAPKLKRDTEPIATGDYQPGWGNNDLQRVVCEHYPVVAEALETLGKLSPARMSGSGACVFAEFPDKTAAYAAQKKLPVKWKSFVAKGL